jgi:hypothetical protein
MSSRTMLKSVLTQDDGQGLTEYALALGVVVLGMWVFVSVKGLDTSLVELIVRTAVAIKVL